MLAKFRDRYPQGSLISKLVQIDRGNFIVKVSIKVENITLVTALAGASNVEAAEDEARIRALEALCLEQHTASPVSAPEFPKNIAAVKSKQTLVENLEIPEHKETNKVARLTETETQSSANFASTNTVSNSSHVASQPQISEPEMVTARSAQDSPNLFEGTFASPSNSSSIANHQHTSIQTAEETNEETNTVSFEFADQPINESPIESSPVIEKGVSADFDFTQVKQKTDIEIARLGWTRDDGREFLQSRYGKRSRLHLKNEELQEFLSYLEQLPTPVN